MTVDEENVPEKYEKQVDNENKKVINELIKYNITTRVEGVGGTISGQDEQIYEEVVIGGTSQKDIVITPQQGYEISSIKINGVEQQLPEYSLRDDTYVLENITNIAEDKNIVVTFRENTMNINVTKVWEDSGSNQQETRPEKIKIVLKSADEIAYSKELVVTQGNSQTILFENVRKYDDNGNPIVYIVDEEEINAGDLYFYTKSINNDTYTITNTFTVPEDRTSVTVTKIWDDNNDIAQKRPQSILVELKDETGANVGTQTLSSTNNWTYTFENLRKYNDRGEEIKYTIDEKEVNEGDLYFYSKSIDNDIYTITNTFTVPEEKISITANKVWNDNDNSARKRPQSVIIDIKNKDEVIQSKQVTSATNWSCEFTDLAKYDELGNEIVYAIDEREVNTDDLKFYEKQVNGYTITNTFRVPDETTSIQVTKVWEDNNNVAQKRPDIIEILVKNGSTIVKRQNITGDTNVWTTQIDGLPMYDEKGDTIRYTIDETNIDFYEKQVNGYTITNTFNVPEDKINMQITKIWEDNSNENGVRPESITLIIKEGVNEIKREEVEVTQDEQVYLVEGLDKYDEYGNEKEYTVDEEVVEGYDKKVEGNIITNSIKKYKITTEVIGTGGTISGQNDSPYEEVTYGGESKKEIVITPEEGYKISKIRINGEEIEFIVSGNEFVLEKFVNVIEDKYIEVEFERQETSVIVKHVDEEGKDLVEPETIPGKVGDRYETKAKEFEEYEVKEVIGNETGEMTKEQITITYVYSKVNRKCRDNKGR